MQQVPPQGKRTRQGNKTMTDDFITEKNSFKYRYDIDEITRLLNKSGISQGEFARKVGIRESTFNAMVRRRVGIVDFGALDKMSIELDVPMEWLVKKRDGFDAPIVPHKGKDGIFIPKRICRVCGDEFYPVRRNQVDCCRKCHYRRKYLKE